VTAWRPTAVLSFVLGVASSIVATALVAIGVRYLPRRAQATLAAIVARAMGCGINRIFPNEDTAASDMLAAAGKSRAIRVLSIRGFRITGEDRPLNKLLGRGFDFETFEVMLANPKGRPAAKRAAGFVQKSAGHPKASLYVRDIEKSLSVLKECSRRDPRIKVRTHSQCESFRLFITDQYIYLSFFPKGQSASTSPVFRIHSGSLLYDSLVAHYEWVRDELSEEYGPRRAQAHHDGDRS